MNRTSEDFQNRKWLLRLRAPSRILCGWGLLLLGGAQAVLGTSTTGTPRWVAMNYGPFLSASIEAPEANVANKGIALRIADAFDGRRGEAVAFDTDLLRYSTGWTGEFLDLKGVAYDGSHGTHPSILGAEQWDNKMLPGWSLTADATDPRELRWGPLPNEWGRWNGLYLHGRQVILSYTVFGAPVMERPSLEHVEATTAFVRLFEVGSCASNLFVQVFRAAAANVSVVGLSSLTEAGASARSGGSIVVARGVRRVIAAGVAGGAPQNAWAISQSGEVRLLCPASDSLRRLKLLIWSGTESELPAFARLVEKSDLPQDVRSLTKGGPPRWPERLSTRGRLGRSTGPFAIDTITWPDQNPWKSWLRFGGFDFFSDTTQAAVCTWNGDVWLVSGIDAALDQLSWQRIATGLFQPLGLRIVEDRIYVLGRDQITLLHDLNGDREADYYENFNNDHQVTTHFHEFAMDLQTDAAGNFYYMKAARHALTPLAPQHGTLLKVTRDGTRTEILANGFRAPNGLLPGRDGEFFSSDQEGHWIPANRLNRIEPGGFYGNRWSYLRAGDLERYKPPLCWLHRTVDRSPSTLVQVNSTRWPALDNHLLSLSYGTGEIFLVLKEAIDGTWQGGVTPLPIEFPTGIMRGRFHPVDEHLYVCGLYGWAGNKTVPGGFYRIRTTGKPIAVPCELRAMKDGLVLEFTAPLDREVAADTQSYSVKRWNYQASEQYGSPDFKLNGERGQETVEITAAVVSSGGRTVFLEIPDICPVMQMHLQMDLMTADGAPMATYVHHTIHRLGARSGREVLRNHPQRGKPQTD